MNENLSILEELQKQRFYGTIEIKLEAGKVVLIRKTQTLKLEEGRDLWGQPRAAKKSN
jgi:hypothetical protein